MLFIWLLTFVGSAFAQWDPHFVPGHAGIVHLFEWHWGTIADECETLLGPNKWGGVQVRFAMLGQTFSLLFPLDFQLIVCLSQSKRS